MKRLSVCGSFLNIKGLINHENVIRVSAKYLFFPSQHLIIIFDTADIIKTIKVKNLK